MIHAPAEAAFPGFSELIASDADASEWATSTPSWQFRVAKLWSRFVPRGKGWFPQFIGHGVGRNARDVTRTPSGAILAMDPGSLDVYCSLAQTGGWWERHVAQALLRFVQPGHVVYDIGANVGFMSAEVAARFGSQRVRVYAFEPQPSLARAIAVTAKLNGFSCLHVLPLMLGKALGEGSLFVPGHSIHASAVSREAGAREIRCPVMTLDHLVASGLPPPDVIKIDVEGSEWDVFQGARETIAAKRPVIVFESDVNASRFGYSRRQLCDFLRSVGGSYRFYAINGEKLTSAEEHMDDPDVTDMVAAPEEIAIPGPLRA